MPTISEKQLQTLIQESLLLSLKKKKYFQENISRMTLFQKQDLFDLLTKSQPTINQTLKKTKNIDQAQFRQIITDSALLSEEQKKQFLSNAAIYTPKARTEMIQILHHYTKEYVEFGKKRLITITQENKDLLHQKMEEKEAFHQKEIAEAESQLEKNLLEID